MNWFEFELSAFLWVFIMLNIVNVVIQTIKSIITVNGGKWSASVVNAVAYGLYTVVVVYMNADGLGLFWKALIIGIANLIGVYVVKLIEEKSRKDRLWEVRATVTPEHIGNVQKDLEKEGISHNCFRTSGEYRVFNIYCPTQKESIKVKEILTKYNAKYFVSESKVL